MKKIKKLTDHNINRNLFLETFPHFIQFLIDRHSTEPNEKYRYGASFDIVYNGILKLNLKREERESRLKMTINSFYS